MAVFTATNVIAITDIFTVDAANQVKGPTLITLTVVADINKDGVKIESFRREKISAAGDYKSRIAGLIRDHLLVLSVEEDLKDVGKQQLPDVSIMASTDLQIAQAAFFAANTKFATLKQYADEGIIKSDDADLVAALSDAQAAYAAMKAVK